MSASVVTVDLPARRFASRTEYIAGTTRAAAACFHLCHVTTDAVSPPLLPMVLQALLAVADVGCDEIAYPLSQPTQTGTLVRPAQHPVFTWGATELRRRQFPRAINFWVLAFHVVPLLRMDAAPLVEEAEARRLLQRGVDEPALTPDGRKRWGHVVRATPPLGVPLAPLRSLTVDVRELPFDACYDGPAVRSLEVLAIENSERASVPCLNSLTGDGNVVMVPGTAKPRPTFVTSLLLALPCLRSFSAGCPLSPEQLQALPDSLERLKMSTGRRPTSDISDAERRQWTTAATAAGKRLTLLFSLKIKVGPQAFFFDLLAPLVDAMADRHGFNCRHDPRAACRECYVLCFTIVTASAHEFGAMLTHPLMHRATTVALHSSDTVQPLPDSFARLKNELPSLPLRSLCNLDDSCGAFEFLHRANPERLLVLDAVISAADTRTLLLLKHVTRFPNLQILELCRRESDHGSQLGALPYGTCGTMEVDVLWRKLPQQLALTGMRDLRTLRLQSCDLPTFADVQEFLANAAAAWPSLDLFGLETSENDPAQYDNGDVVAGVVAAFPKLKEVNIRHAALSDATFDTMARLRSPVLSRVRVDKARAVGHHTGRLTAASMVRACVACPVLDLAYGIFGPAMNVAAETMPDEPRTSNELRKLLVRCKLRDSSD